MDNLNFKSQPNRASLAVVIQSSDISKRALLKSLHDESILAGSKIILKAVIVANDDNALVQSMTFGLEADTQKKNISYDTFWTNLIQPAAVLMLIVFTNTTKKAAQISGGVTPNGFELFESVTIEGKENDKDRDKLTTVVVNKPFDMDLPSTVFFHHAGTGDDWNDAILNAVFLFQ